MMVTNFKRLSSSKKIPLNPPLLKGGSIRRGAWSVPLFEKEELGEIFHHPRVQ